MAPPFRPPVPEPLHGPTWVRPAGNLEYRVTQSFQNVNPKYPGDIHRALDLGNTRLGGPVTAPAAGIVVAEGFLREPWSASSSQFGTGNFGGIMCVIDHGGGWVSAIAHMANTIVNAGQRILDHQLLGYLGDTGSAQGQGHVHWDLYKDRVKVDPWPLLAQNYRLPDTSTGDDVSQRYGGADLIVDPGMFASKQGARMRATPKLTGDILDTLDAGEAVGSGFKVKGDTYNGSPWWRSGYRYVGVAFVEGFWHESTVDRVEAPVPVPPPPDCTADVARAVKPLLDKISAAKAALG